MSDRASRPSPVPALTPDGCRARQARLREVLGALGLEAALLCDPRYVHYFTGYWTRLVFTRVALIEREGPTTVIVPREPEAPPTADAVRIFESSKLGTLVDHPLRIAIPMLDDRLDRLDRLGVDAASPPVSHRAIQPAADLEDTLLALRRTKDPDEVALLRRALAAAESAYRYARAALEAGVSETDLFGGMQAAAAADAGETLGEFGNDFQIGATGSAPRRRAAVTGDIAIFDLSVTIRGYRSDMCRSFVVGGRPSEQQRRAHDRVRAALGRAEDTLVAGARCRAVDREVRRLLDGYEGWTFPHHLGHGIGLDPHEAPRINPHWDDTLAPGDVIAVEPGLYGPDLRAGLRIEEVYHVTATGLDKLTSFPIDLA